MNQLSSDESYKIWVLLTHVRNLIFKARERELNESGVSAVQAGVLHVIKALGQKATPGVISKWMLREPHTISNALTRMQKQGLVRKTRSLGKKRNVFVSLTEKGEQAHLYSLNRKAILGIMSCLSEEEAKQMISLLERLRKKALNTLVEAKELPFP